MPYKSTCGWIPKSGNSDWLLIFDNAHNLDAFYILKFFWAVSWGHIITTSCDLIAIGPVGRERILLEPPETKEGMSLLIEKARTLHQSAADHQQAQAIVNYLADSSWL
jgi:hypothetical protein